LIFHIFVVSGNCFSIEPKNVNIGDIGIFAQQKDFRTMASNIKIAATFMRVASVPAGWRAMHHRYVVHM
jgi:hypothetical protein